MVRSILGVVLVSFSLSGLVGCSDDPDSKSGTSRPAGQEEGTKDPTKSSEKTDPADDEDKTSSVGPECDAYFDCCDEVAKEQPSLAGSCDQTRKAVDDAVKKGAPTETYESSCKQAMGAMQSAGYCK